MFVKSFEDEFHYAALSTPSCFRLLSIDRGGNKDGSPSIQIQLKEYDSKDPFVYKALSYTWSIDRSHRKSLVKVFPWVLLIAPLIVFLHLARKTSDIYKTGPFEKWGRWMGISGGGGKDHDEADFTWNIDSISAAPTTGTCLEPPEESHPPFGNSHGNLPNQDQRSSKHGAIDGDRNDISKSTDITNEEDTPRTIARAHALQSTRKQRAACFEDNILPSSASGEPSLASTSDHSARIKNVEF